MPPITNDPTLAICPDFESPEWAFLRQSIIDTHRGPQPPTAEEAAQQMKEAWTAENNNRIAVWNAQLEQERTQQEELERQAAAEEETRRVQREEEAQEQRREIERKKPKLNPFDPNLSVGSWIEPRPAQYALKKLKDLQYVELDYFTIRACQEAAADPNRSISLNTFGFTLLENTIALRPLAAQNPSKNIRNDAELSWEEMMDAKNTMLHFMAELGCPRAHAKSLAAFYVTLELHPRRLLPNGKKALLIYQSIVRRKWFDALDADVGFNIELIREELLRSCAEKVNDAIRDREIEQAFPPLALTHCSLTRHGLLLSPPRGSLLAPWSLLPPRASLTRHGLLFLRALPCIAVCC